MKHGRFVRDTLGMASSQFVARGVLLARGLVSAVALGPAGYGAWNALNLIFDYGAYSQAGALQGLDQVLPAAAARGDRGEERRLLAGAWSVVVAGGAVFALGVSAVLAVRGRDGLGVGVAPALMLAAALLQLAVQYHGSALRARGRFLTVSGAVASQALVGGGLGLVLVWRLGILGLLAGWLVGTLVALALMRRDAPDVPLRPAAPAVGAGLARAGFAIFAFFTASLVLRSVDRLALLRYGTRADLGHYSLGLMTAALILYLPEAMAAVLYPRIVAAAQGARDATTTRHEVDRAHRALAVTLPLGVAIGMVWAGPVVAALMPDYQAGVPALGWLALGALLLSAATVPAYVLLGHGRAMNLLAVGATAAVINAALVFVVAARDHRPATVALAATAGYALFAFGLIALAARELFTAPAERFSFVIASLVPAAWAGALALGSQAFGGPDSLRLALARSAVIVLGYLPALWWFGRRLGIKRLARDWIATRPIAA